MAELIFHIGKMRQTATFKKNNPVANSSGGQDDNFTDLLTTRCFLQKDSGNFNAITGQMVYNKNYTMICRYQAAIEIDTDTKIVINNQWYSIKDFERIDQQPHLYTFKLTKDE